jgi:hypothetical protein
MGTHVCAPKFNLCIVIYREDFYSVFYSLFRHLLDERSIKFVNYSTLFLQKESKRLLPAAKNLRSSSLYAETRIHANAAPERGAFQNGGNHYQPAGFMNPAPERSSPGRIRNPPGKKEKRPKLNCARNDPALCSLLADQL